MIGRVFEGLTVWLVAGGPSLRGFDLTQLDGETVIAINGAAAFLPRAAMVYWTDAFYWRAERAMLAGHPAILKATATVYYVPNDDLPIDVHRYPFTGEQGFDPDPRFLRHGSTSAYAAMHLAAHLGASRLMLMGYDMRHADDGATHWYRVPKYTGTAKEATLTELMLPNFATIAPALAERGIEVINASPDSRIDCWPRVSLAEAMRWRGKPCG